MTTHPNLAAVCDFVDTMSQRSIAPELIDAAKQSLVDWFAVSIAALCDPAPSIVRDRTLAWGSTGGAWSLYGDLLAAAPAALINATAAHTLDYDDVHLPTAYHASAPTLAAVLAVGAERGMSGAAMLRAFIAGFEVGCTMGDDGIGVALADCGWHPTGVLGHFSATAALAVLLGLTRAQVGHALGLAVTQTGGLQASGGSMAKPFHVGKAAMNSVIAADFAAAGLEAELRLLDDPNAGILGCLFQRAQRPSFAALGSRWQILRNSFKPYAACQLTHAAFEAGQRLSQDFEPAGLRSVRAHVNPLAPKVASRGRPQAPMEGKFSIPYLVALGLKGYCATPPDFTPERLADTALLDLTDRVQVVTDEKIERWSALVELHYDDGTVRFADTAAALGSHARPLGWPNLEAKFMACVSPVLGAQSTELLAGLRRFDEANGAERLAAFLESHRDVLARARFGG